MLNGDFLKTVEELHYNRGITIAQIARELGVSRRLIYFLRNFQKPVTPKILKRAEVIFPELLSKNPPLPGSDKFREEIYYFQGKKALEKSVIDTIEKNRLLRERIMGVKKEGEPNDEERNRIRRERLLSFQDERTREVT